MSGLEHLPELVVFGWAGRRLLGPTLDAIGQDIADRYSESRQRNFVRIARNAEAKAGDALDQPGSVNPRIAEVILEDGSWCDGPVMAEYFGGILANSRSPDGGDDRGLSWAGLVSRLCTSDIHLHYLFYDAFHVLYLGSEELELGRGAVRDRLMIYMGRRNILMAMGVEPNRQNGDKYLVPSMNALVREGLVGEIFYAFATRKQLSDEYRIDAPDAGMILVPSIAGMDLFLWAFNHGDRPVAEFLSPDLQFVSQEGLTSVLGARKVDDLRREQAERIMPTESFTPE